ncbi:WS/DGAT domain-containing protein [Gordonia sp. SMJS1]|uniref:WS/DGAT domain-containing protein n=1 Tax=Gordonia sp. SMJS1 TaxID=3039400 RepID=UPI002456282B|nr:WS/DGAT domain-containing protein [Gordonia sp. SMJS1]WGJ84417.1 WS/DGAT domain-containing protein [Gordonia sp. SMJS1]
MHRMAAADAVSYWMSQCIPNDEFLVYCSAAPRSSIEDCAARLRLRAPHVDDLCLRIRDVPGTADRPYWESVRPADDQVRVDASSRTWSSCLTEIAGLIAQPLDPTREAWRAHLFGPVADVPAATGPVVVVVLQVCHALGDGRRMSRIARDWFTAPATPRRPLSEVRSPFRELMVDAGTALGGVLRFPGEFVTTAWRGVRAARLASASVPGTAGYAPTRLNVPPGPRRTLRVLVVARDQLSGPGVPVTVAVLTAISVAFPEYLGDRDRRYGAELTVGRGGERRARNHFRNAGIDLHIDIDDLGERARLIGAEIAAARAAEAEPLRVAQRRASESTPAILTRWGIRSFDLDTPPATVTGVTVVSSVNRGAADLDLDGGEILFTTGLPAQSPAQGLTHGVHGIGDRIAISVTTSPDVMNDVDRYVELLARALGV